jgi:putative nucleotidyltransferase with HDIG domain
VPLHIRGHSNQVARLARRLAEALREHAHERVDAERVEAAALLHDIAKARCLKTGRDHSADGGELLRGLGLETIAALVEQHVRLREWEPEGRVSEAEILNYCDKRVLHEEVVTLEERFRDLAARYGRGDPSAEAAIRRNERAARGVERKIFDRLPFGPEKIAEVM